MRKVLNFVCSMLYIMARAFDPLGKSNIKSILPTGRSRNNSSKDLIDTKLQAAKEILAEVFGITVAEVEEMIKRRSEERIQWPEKFWLEK
jgi:hypothetical protein